MEAIVYVGHGSRFEEGNRQFCNFIQSVMKETNYSMQEIGFLEATNPTLFQSLEKIIAKGATNITVAPALLFAAAHFKRDIPNTLQEIKKLYPHVSFRITEPFGAHPLMIQLVIERVQEIKKGGNNAVLLIGRGSSDPEPARKLKEISREAERILQLPVYEAFLSIETPTMEEALLVLTNKYETVYVIPYLLFTGLLLKKIEACIDSFQANIVLGPCLQYSNHIKLTLLQQLEKSSPYILEDGI